MSAMVSTKGQPAHEGASQAAIYGRRLRRNRLMLVGALLLLIMIGMAVLGPILYPTDPLLIDLKQKLLPLARPTCWAPITSVAIFWPAPCMAPGVR